MASVFALGIACRTNHPPDVQWERTFQSYDTWIPRVVQTNDGGYIAVGSVTPSYAEHDAYLLKLDPSGDLEWQRSFDAGKSGFVCSVRQTVDGGFVLAGRSSDSDKIAVFKTNSLGDPEWVFSDFWGATNYTAEQTSDGGYITGGLWPEGESLYLLKLDVQGHFVWRKCFKGGYGHWNAEIPVRQTLDGGYIMASEVLLKTNAFGDEVWRHSYEDVLVLFSVCEVPGGGFVAAGIARASWPTSYFKPFNMVLLRTDANGTFMWKRVFTDGIRSRARCVSLARNGGFILSGSVNLDHLDHGRVVKTDFRGNPIWMKTFPERTVLDFGQQTSDGGYLVGSGDVHIWKLAPDRKR